MGEKVLEIEKGPNDEIVVRIRPYFMPQIPYSTKEHIRAAGKEVLIAMRNLIDAVVEYSEAKEARKGQPRTKVEVE